MSARCGGKCVPGTIFVMPNTDSATARSTNERTHAHAHRPRAPRPRTTKCPKNNTSGDDACKHGATRVGTEDGAFVLVGAEEDGHVGPSPRCDQRQRRVLQADVRSVD